MVSNWYMTSCSFLCCVFTFHLLRVTPVSPVLSPWWLGCPPVAAILSHWGRCRCRAPHAHPPQQYYCCCSLLPDFYSTIATFIPACFSYSLSQTNCSASSLTGFMMVVVASLYTWHHCRELLLTSLSGPERFHLELTMHSQVSTGLLCNLDLLLDWLSGFLLSG